MKQIVFYSWQSDLPNACNRGFIQDALEKAAATIKADDTVSIEPVVDRDTQGVPGAPDISSTIFAKITAADVFVADVSIIGRDEARATPNPNVLIELGYALKALGHERIILVFNRTFGKLEELPFDLRTRRVLAYELSPGQTKGPERTMLEKQFEVAILAALKSVPEVDEPIPIPAVAAIEHQQPNRIVVLRRNLSHILKTLEGFQPKKHSEGGTVEELIDALRLTQEPIAEFSKIAEIIATMTDSDAASELYRWFGVVFERYDLPENFTGRSSNADQDYFKFVGHELFVTMVGLFIREQRWNILGAILAEPLPMRFLATERGPGTVSWNYASEFLPSIADEARKRQRLSLHADILNERHTTGGLAAIMPMAEFAGADYFLFLFGEMVSEQASDMFVWCPWSSLYLKSAPLFLRSAEHKRVAEHLLRLFKLSSPDEFRKRFAERGTRLGKLFGGRGFWSNPIRSDDVKDFGTK